MTLLNEPARLPASVGGFRDIDEVGEFLVREVQSQPLARHVDGCEQPRSDADGITDAIICQVWECTISAR